MAAPKVVTIDRWQQTRPPKPESTEGMTLEQQNG